jgi:RHS repeat-associated protein
MSNKSGASAQVIALPQGGGALRGIGEKFTPDLHMGTGSFTIPIALPPGRNSFQPELNLAYNTGNGNSHFGLGWGISAPGVSRKTSDGVPRYDDKRDTFILSGAEDLVAVQQLPGVTRYRPRTEGLFARIEHHLAGGNNFWKVWNKDGLISFYGTPRPTGAPPDWQDPAVVADPNDQAKVFAWKITRTLDPFGNSIEYEYDHDLGNDGPHYWDELYLSRIRYVDYSVDEEIRFLVSVSFEYEARSDPYSQYRAGFEMRIRRRCNRITIRTHAGEDRLVRSYHLTYFDQREDIDDLEDLLPLNRASLLSQIKAIGHDIDLTEELPPLEFGYTAFEPRLRDFIKLNGRDLPAASLASPDLDLIDLIGNGLPDFFETNGTVRYWRNLGAGQFDLPRDMRDAPAGLRLADPAVQLIDANGDGRIDLLVTKEDVTGYYPLRFGGFWDRRSFQRYRQSPSFNLEDPEVRFVDLDGDGVTDAMRASTRMEYFFNDPVEGWNDTRQVERGALDVFPNVNFSDPRVKWGDMSGDGLQDIALVYDGNVEYWPNLGYGNWGKRISMRNSPRLPYGYDPKRILMGDVDGDGLADLVYVDHSSVTVWINQSGDAWSDPVTVKGTPPVSDSDAVRLIDLLGIGVSGLLWTSAADGQSRHNLFFLDLTGGVKPYLLNEMNNHIGCITRVGYAPSTRFYIEDEQRPETRWKTPLPFPVQVVARAEVIDQLSRSKLASEFKYHHGYWDGAEHEFRGFGRVEQMDTESFEDYNKQGLHGEQVGFERIAQAQHFSPPTLTKTWFHQGPVGDEFGEWEEVDYSGEYWSGDGPFLKRLAATTAFLNGLPRRAKRDALRALRANVLHVEFYALDGTALQDRPYTVAEYAYGLREENPPDPDDSDRMRIFFPHLTATRTTQWDRGDDPMTKVGFTSDYDDYGQSRVQVNIAVPRNRDYRVSAPQAEPYLATSTVTSYAQRDDEAIYIVNRTARVSAYEILNDGSSALLDFSNSILSGAAARRLIDQSFNFYDGSAFEGLPVGQLGDYGALARIETMSLTETILHEAYKSGDTVMEPPEVPPYLSPGAEPAWTAEYPEAFRSHLSPLAGYLFYEGGDDSTHERGYFVISTRQSYDFHDDLNGVGRGLLRARRDPSGNDTLITYDDFDLLPVEVTDPLGLVTRAAYDYRAFQASLVTDINLNRTAYAFTPLGRLASTSVMGKEGEAVGDTQEVPGIRMEYDTQAFVNRQQPISVRTIARQHSVNETDVPPLERDETIETIEYSDGLGRLLQTRTQTEGVAFGDAVFGSNVGLPVDQNIPAGDAVGQQLDLDDAPRVAVSGWRRYDNKGQVIEQYEPFFSIGWEYAPPEEEQLGQKATLFRDPRGHVIRMVSPDGSEQRTVYGVPTDLSHPEQFSPTPWETFTYDANDNAGHTHPAVTLSYQDHWHTPTSIIVDALGRAIETTNRNGPDSLADWHVTRSTYDIKGNLLTVTDALGRVAFRYVYDLAKNLLRTESVDAGAHRIVLSATGSTVEQRDSKGALILQAYDLLNRPARFWSRDDTGQPLTLRQHFIYGDSPESGLALDEARAANLLGKLYQHYDDAGRLIFASYDFKGNLREKSRQVIGDAVILGPFNPPPPNWQVQAFSVDWQPPDGVSLSEHADNLLDPFEYRTSVSYDALSRIKLLLYPEDVEHARRELRPRYNRAGALESVDLNSDVFVERIIYNAKGQRTLVAYGNGVMTRYAYDSQTSRLRRLRSERYTQPEALTYHPTGAPLQDFAYTYDFVGNITTIRDRTPESGIPNTLLGTDALDRNFTYDPIYRLISATGRECDAGTPVPPWFDEPRCADVTLARAYTERYQYDPAGNLLSLQHQASGGGFTREFALAANSNRLETLTVGDAAFAYTYDANGNVTGETASRHFDWDYGDRLKVYRTQIAGAEPSVYAHYLYDSGGQRVKKLVRRQGGQFEATVYIDGLLEHHRRVANGDDQENNSLQIMDDKERMALVRIGEPFPDDTTPAVKFHLSDQIGSSNLVIGDTGDWINREEFTPYGETSFGSFSRKRYRYSGKERDEESGLYYHGARYYMPWAARWTAPDPTHAKDTSALYIYALNNPVRLVDPDGKKPVYDEQVKTKLASIVETANKVDLFTKITGRDLFIRFNFWDEENTLSESPYAEFKFAHQDRTVYRDTAVLYKSEMMVDDELFLDPTAVFATLMHETYHHKYYYEAKELVDKGKRKALYNSATEHRNMARDHIDDMIAGMKEFDKLSGAEHSEDWYKAMAWEGLHKTSLYEEYVKTAEGQRVDKMMKNERNYNKWLELRITFEKTGGEMSKDEVEEWSYIVSTYEQSVEGNEDRQVDWNLVYEARKGTGRMYYEKTTMTR